MSQNNVHDIEPENSATHIAAEPLHWGWRLLLFGLWLCAFGLPLFWIDVLVNVPMGDWSLGYWLLAQGIVIIFVILTAIYAWLANRSERIQTPRH